MSNGWMVIAAIAGIGAVTVGLYKTPASWRDRPSTPVAVSKLGYLAPGELPSTSALLPPPPAAGSKGMEEDELARTAAITLKGSPRYALAVTHADRSHDNTVNAFQCAFGTRITSTDTPGLYRLLARVRLDVRAASYSGKTHFKRPRPFMVHQTRTCYPDDEAMTSGDGSYPSARGAVGWAFAFVLADLRPDRSDAILQQARDFGDSRVICDQEWQSDVEAGRAVAVAMMQKLKANEAYKADFAQAQKEVAKELGEGTGPSIDCATEHAALASR